MKPVDISPPPPLHENRNRNTYNCSALWHELAILHCFPNKGGFEVFEALFTLNSVLPQRTFDQIKSTYLFFNMFSMHLDNGFQMDMGIQSPDLDARMKSELSRVFGKSSEKAGRVQSKWVRKTQQMSNVCH
jgi:hypothetical protein